ncbi:hypothetical protein JI435_043600, partial [Parastagonospora nodorum SN15]
KAAHPHRILLSARPDYDNNPRACTNNNSTKSLFQNKPHSFGPRQILLRQHPTFEIACDATVKMLRRPATTIQLTAADVEQYEANRQRKLYEQQQAQAQKQASSQTTETSENTKNRSQAASAKSKQDRIMGGRGN